MYTVITPAQIAACLLDYQVTATMRCSTAVVVTPTIFEGEVGKGYVNENMEYIAAEAAADGEN